MPRGQYPRKPRVRDLKQLVQDVPATATNSARIAVPDGSVLVLASYVDGLEKAAKRWDSLVAAMSADEDL